MRRDAPSKAARGYADALRTALAEDDDSYDMEIEHENTKNRNNVNGNEEDNDNNNDNDVEMDVKHDSSESSQNLKDGMGEHWLRDLRRKHPDWILNVPPGTAQEQERWREGEMGAVYSKALETLFHLQGDASAFDSDDENTSNDDAWGSRSTALATTVGKVERARQATEVIEKS